jgi:hypothetical protein
MMPWDAQGQPEMTPEDRASQWDEDEDEEE